MKENTLLVIYENNCVISNFLINSIKKMILNKKINYDIVYYEKEEYQKKYHQKLYVLPQILVYNSKKLEKKILGFKHYMSILDELE